MTTNNINKYYDALQNAKDAKVVTFYDYPEDWPRFHNACSDPCDMLIGPCACGAWHHLKDWQPGSNFAQRLGIQDVVFLTYERKKMGWVDRSIRL